MYSDSTADAGAKRKLTARVRENVRPRCETFSIISDTQYSRLNTQKTQKRPFKEKPYCRSLPRRRRCSINKGNSYKENWNVQVSSLRADQQTEQA